PGWEQIYGDMVTQKGAISVTNPDGSSEPEVVKWELFSGDIYPTLSRYSSLLPLGANVLTWESEYKDFGELFVSGARAFAAHYPGKGSFILDFEYKKDRNLGLVMKQVREIPDSSKNSPTPAFLVDAPGPLVVAQMEAGDVFGNHRLKSTWDLRARNMWLVSSNLAQGIYTTGTLEFIEDGGRASPNGAVTFRPHSALSPDGKTNYWTTGIGTKAWDWQLETDVSTMALDGDPPVFTTGD